MSLIAENSVRESTIPVFFDMMAAEYYSAPIIGGDGSKRQSYKGNFKSFEAELIQKLDEFFDKGRGDAKYIAQFTEKYEPKSKPKLECE